MFRVLCLYVDPNKSEEVFKAGPEIGLLESIERAKEISNDFFSSLLAGASADPGPTKKIKPEE